MDNKSLFSSRVDAVINSKIIISDRAIAQLLKCIASVDEFTECIRNSLTQYPYVNEFSRARIEYPTKDGTMKYKLNIPSETNRLFTFVVCLLTELDNKRRNILDFLREYFSSTNNNDSYVKFCESVLIPFKSAGERILGAEVPVVVDLYKEAEEFFAESGAFISSLALSQLQVCINDIKENIASDGVIPQLERNNLLLMLTTLGHSLQLKKLRLIKVSYLAILAHQLPFNCQETFSTVGKILTQCNII